MPSGSYYWSPGYSDPELSRDEIKALGYAVVKLNSGENPQPYYRILLTNENMKLKGFALDRFYTHESQAEKPEDNPLQQYIPEILAEARAQLQQPPVHSYVSIKGDVVGANHASAFLVLSVVGTASDLDLIAPILHSSSDLNVIYTGCLAAIHCLETTVNVNPPQVFPEIVSALRKHLFNEPDLTIHLRTDSESSKRAKFALLWVVKKQIQIEVNKQLQDRFRCYYWNPLDIIDPLLGQAYILLVYSDKRNVLNRCYHQLLTSDEPAAIGIALDRYSYTHHETRFTNDNPYAVYAEETLLVAREQLQLPPIVRVTTDGETIAGANYASALSVMEYLGKKRDIPLIENILAHSSDSVVVRRGCWAFSSILKEQPTDFQQTVYDEKLLKILDKIVRNESLSITARSLVFEIIGSNYDLDGLVKEWLLSIVQSSLPMKFRSMAATRLKSGHPQYQQLYDELYQSWLEYKRAKEDAERKTDAQLEAELKAVTQVTLEQETEPVTTQPSQPLTDIRFFIVTQKQAKLDEINTQITQLDSQINHLNQRIDNLSGGRYNPATTERSLELKQKIKQLNLQKLELESEQASLEEAIAFYQQ